MGGKGAHARGIPSTVPPEIRMTSWLFRCYVMNHHLQFANLQVAIRSLGGSHSCPKSSPDTRKCAPSPLPGTAHSQHCWLGC